MGVMSAYMKALGLVLVVLGMAGSIYCWRAAASDEVYFRALRGYERYPGNVLYLQELKMAEPRHMLLLGGAWSAAPAVRPLQYTYIMYIIHNILKLCIFCE